MPIPPDVTFLYFGKPQGGARAHHGVITVAMRVKGHCLHLGFSFCSSKDPWCKAMGRDMALARLLNPTIIIPCLYFPKRTAQEVAMAVARHDFDLLETLCPGSKAWGHCRVPSWTRKLGRVIRTATEISRRMKRFHRTHAADALGYLTRIKAAPGSPIDWARHLRGGAPIDEAAEISPETWARLDKVLQERTHKPKPTAAQILARMMRDISELEGSGGANLSRLIDKFDPNG
jgi:hypothetical protein